MDAEQTLPVAPPEADWGEGVIAVLKWANRKMPKGAEFKPPRARRRYLDAPERDHWSDSEVDDYEVACEVIDQLRRVGCVE